MAALGYPWLDFPFFLMSEVQVALTSFGDCRDFAGRSRATEALVHLSLELDRDRNLKA